MLLLIIYYACKRGKIKHVYEIFHEATAKND